MGTTMSACLLYAQTAARFQQTGGRWSKVRDGFGRACTACSCAIGAAQVSAPLVTVKVCQDVETAALLAKPLLYPILEQGRQLQMLLTNAIALIVLLFLCKILVAAIHLWPILRLTHPGYLRSSALLHSPCIALAGLQGSTVST